MDWKQKIDQKLSSDEKAKIKREKGCHIKGCSVISRIEYKKETRSVFSGGPDGDFETREETITVLLDVRECLECKKYTCNEHLWRGFCIECALKKYPQIYPSWHQNVDQSLFGCHIEGCTVIGQSDFQFPRYAFGWHEHIIKGEIQGVGQCSNCHKVTCTNHLYRGICQECAEKME